MPVPQPIPMSEVEREAHTDGVILSLLLDHDAQRPWTVQEIARELDDLEDAATGLRRLVAAGLVHRLHDFVFASRAALRADQITQ
jgi:predicted transcriptional regulator